MTFFQVTSLVSPVLRSAVFYFEIMVQCTRGETLPNFWCGVKNFIFRGKKNKFYRSTLFLCHFLAVDLEIANLYYCHISTTLPSIYCGLTKFYHTLSTKPAVHPYFSDLW